MTNITQRCFEILCYEYLSTGVIINISIVLIRCLVCVVVLLLGMKMPQDFMRTVTMSVFIPIGCGELFNLYLEVVGYLQYYQSTSLFYTTYIEWTSDFQNVFYDYVHYDFMVVIIIGLHCCRLCCRDDESIHIFPVKTITIVLQVIPLFLCLLQFVKGEQGNIVIKVILIVSKLITFVCFVTVTLQIIVSCYLITKELPYDHAASTDMQIRDARSRLAWFLMYLIIPYMSMIPFFLDSIVWTIQQANGLELIYIVVDDNGEPIEEQLTQIGQWTAVLEMLQFLVHYYRPTWLVILTIFLLPPYRRAMPLLFCCCPCCPQLKVEPLPRKEKDMSMMYKNAE